MLLIKTKLVYGVSKIYPANELAQTIAKLAGTTTLTEKSVTLAMQMGFPVRQAFPNGEIDIHQVADIVPA